ncbi:MAG TPA: biopolymer transporter ExbD [Thermoanaerobaculia bacterium]|nr:biopolymer transporter ExbD [Thermoanaerobaculia bacterium]
MQVGGGGSVNSEINVTPLVDVVLVLLIIFMVISPVVQMGYLVKVPPKAPPVPSNLTPDQIIFRLLPDNRVLINKDEMTMTEFPQRVREILKGNTSKMVFFSGDPTVDYDSTLRFLDLAKASGAQNIGIIVEDIGATP